MLLLPHNLLYHMCIRQGRFRSFPKNRYGHILCQILLITSAVLEYWPQFRDNFISKGKNIFFIILCDQKLGIKYFVGKRPKSILSNGLVLKLPGFYDFGSFDVLRFRDFNQIKKKIIFSNPILGIVCIINIGFKG